MTPDPAVFMYVSSDRIDFTFNADKVKNIYIQNADILAGSYRVLDQDAVFLKEIRLNRFPRYLIYDRNGKLVDPDAPRPSNSRVDMALKRWL